MGEVADRYARVAAGFTACVNGCPTDRWTSASPCEDWTTRDVVAHVVLGHRRAIGRLDGVEPAALAPDDDAGAAWRVASGAVAAALADPARAGEVIATPFGEQPFEALVGTALCADTLTHTWDLARATGQDEQLDPDAVAAAMAWVMPLDAMMRGAGAFGPKVAPPPGADDQRVMLCFLGRSG